MFRWPPLRLTISARFLAGVLLLLTGLTLAPRPARAQVEEPAVEEQALVDRATLTVQEMLTSTDGPSALGLVQHARAVLICPRVFTAAFLIGGQYGGCVLVARDAAGSWSYPAFYELASGSGGFQIGLQDQELMMMILTTKGLNAIMDSQFKIGVDGGLTVATVSIGAEAATTAAFRADIVALSRSRGLFGGVSLTGSLLSTQSGSNLAYYGADYSSRQIVVAMQARNPGADPLREALTRAGSSLAPGQTPAYTPAVRQDQDQGSYSNAPPINAAPQPVSPVQQQSLPAPQ